MKPVQGGRNQRAECQMMSRRAARGLVVPWQMDGAYFAVCWSHVSLS